MGKIEMTSENTGTWNPVGKDFKSGNALEKTKRWDKRSESRDHFKSDFRKGGSPAGSQRGRSSQACSITDQQNAAPLNIRGGGPGSYSVASSEAMRNWNRGPPAVKEWTQGDASSKENGGPPAAFDPWTANLPTGGFPSETKAAPQTQLGAWGTGKETNHRPGSKKSSKKGSTVSRNPDSVPGAWGESTGQDHGKNDAWGGNDNQNQDNNGDDWAATVNANAQNNDEWNASGDQTYGKNDAWGGNDNQNQDKNGDEWGATGDANAQNNDEWNFSGDQSQGKNDDWNNNNGGFSSWDTPNNDEKKDDGAWDPPNETSNGEHDEWGGNENNETKQNGEWEATNEDNTKKNDEWGATTGNDAQQANSWGVDIGQQPDNWGGEDTKQVTTGAKDPEKEDKPTSNQQAGSGEKAGLSFGNSRVKGRKSAPKAGSQGKPASVKPTADANTSNKKPLTFDWPKPNLKKTSNASGPPVDVKKASIPGAWTPPVATPKQEGPQPVAAQVPPTFSISTPPKPKPYWSKWKNPNTLAEAETEEEQAPSPDEIEEPVYSIPAEVARRNMMSHQVHPGRPAAYTHKRNKPQYMDTHESPYAVFLFKYRDKEIIEHMLKMTVAEPEVDEKARLASLSKKELIEELMKTKSKLSEAESDPSGQATFVKKLDEKLSRLESGKEDVPAVGEWVNTTSPTHGQGLGSVGEWGNNGTQKATGGGGTGNGIETSNTHGGDWGGNGAQNDDINGNGQDSWGGNGDSNANGKSDWVNNGNGESSNQAGENGNGGNTWDNTDQNNSWDKKDDSGCGGNDNGGGGW